MPVRQTTATTGLRSVRIRTLVMCIACCLAGHFTAVLSTPATGTTARLPAPVRQGTLGVPPALSVAAGAAVDDASRTMGTGSANSGGAPGVRGAFQSSASPLASPSPRSSPSDAGWRQNPKHVDDTVDPAAKPLDVLKTTSDRAQLALSRTRLFRSQPDATRFPGCSDTLDVPRWCRGSWGHQNASAQATTTNRKIVAGVLFSPYQYSLFGAYLEEALPFVDHMIVIEAPLSFRCVAQPQVLTMSLLRDMLSERPALVDKLVLVQPDKASFSKSLKSRKTWRVEDRIRTLMADGLDQIRDKLEPDNTVIVANLDVDEMIHRRSLLMLRHCPTLPTRHVLRVNGLIFDTCADYVNYAAFSKPTERMVTPKDLKLAHKQGEALRAGMFLAGVPHYFAKEAQVELRKLGVTASNCYIERDAFEQFGSWMGVTPVKWTYVPLLMLQFKQHARCMLRPSGNEVRGVVFTYTSWEDLQGRFLYKFKGSTHGMRAVKPEVIHEVSPDGTKYLPATSEVAGAADEGELMADIIIRRGGKTSDAILQKVRSAAEIKQQQMLPVERLFDDFLLGGHLSNFLSPAEYAAKKASSAHLLTDEEWTHETVLCDTNSLVRRQVAHFVEHGFFSQNLSAASDEGNAISRGQTAAFISDLLPKGKLLDVAGKLTKYVPLRQAPAVLMPCKALQPGNYDD